MMPIAGCLLAGVLAASLCLSAQNPPSAPPAKAPRAEAHTGEVPARALPTDYQTHTKVGEVTIAAEFVGAFFPVPEGTLKSEDYVAVETALFGPPGARLKLSIGDFSLRINGKKALASEHYGIVTRNVKDPEWEPPEAAEAKKSKGGLTGNGSGTVESAPPPIIHVPLELQRAWNDRLTKASLSEGDRPLPQAGLVFFPYRGKAKGIRSVELVYEGPAGKAALALQP
jgi:hypothetical protein